MSILTHLIGGFLVFIIAHFYGADIDFFRSVFIYVSSIVIQGVASISPGGLGVTEGGMTGILLLSNVDISKALAIVLLFRVVTLLYSVILGLVFLTVFYGKSLLKKEKTKKNHG